MCIIFRSTSRNTSTFVIVKINAIYEFGQHSVANLCPHHRLLSRAVMTAPVCCMASRELSSVCCFAVLKAEIHVTLLTGKLPHTVLSSFFDKKY